MNRSSVLAACLTCLRGATCLLVVLLSAMAAHAQAADVALTKVTIAVDGMMKSKSGAT